MCGRRTTIKNYDSNFIEFIVPSCDSAGEIQVSVKFNGKIKSLPFNYTTPPDGEETIII